MVSGTYIGHNSSLKGKTALVFVAGEVCQRSVVQPGRIMVQTDDSSIGLGIGWHEFPAEDWEVAWEELRLADSFDECLRIDALAVITPVPSDLRKVIKDMAVFMVKCTALGVAATQFGIPFRIFVVHLLNDNNPFGSPGLHWSNVIMVNPFVTTEEGSQIDFEGCLSFPGIQAEVERPQKIGVTWDDMDGGHHHGEFTDDNARVIMHEYDHLNGIVFLDYVEGFKQFTQRS